MTDADLSESSSQQGCSESESTVGPTVNPGRGPVTWSPVAMIRHELGSDNAEAAEDERPARTVSVGSFAVATIDREMFASFTADAGYRTMAEEEGSGFLADASDRPVPGASWRHPQGPGTGPGSAADVPAGGPGDLSEPDQPVTQISWFDARAYCHWSGHRLLTEAEWETAARLGAIDADQQVWCEDWYDPVFHRDEQRVNPTGPNSGVERVARGGGDRVTRRFHYLPDFSHDRLGMAVVRSPYSQ